MKKLVILSIAVCLLIFSSQAQTKVSLTFTAQYQDGSFVQLDSIQIFNITQSWNETLYYPDTILEMETTSVSIASLEKNSLELSSAVPNPFNGTTNISLQLPQNETVTLYLYDINGKEYLSRSLELRAGKHNLKLTMVTPQIYFLQVRTSVGNKTIKLLNQGKGKNFDLEHNQISPKIARIKSSSGDLGAKTTKLATTNTFKPNDEMLFIGYRTNENRIDTAQIRVRQAAVNTTYTFGFQIGYAIGDVYYKDGIAEGMVWWLADTIVMAEGVPYGQHGKLISLTEPVKPVNQDGLMWGIEYHSIIVPAYDTVDGKANTEIIRNYRDTSTFGYSWRFQAMSWCVDSLGGDWYLPAISELRTIIELVVPVLNPALEKISGAIKFITLSNVYYWSSTADENNNLNAYLMVWRLYPHYSDIPDYYSSSRQQTTYAFVRAVKWF